MEKPSSFIFLVCILIFEAVHAASFVTETLHGAPEWVTQDLPKILCGVAVGVTGTLVTVLWLLWKLMTRGK